MTRFLIGLAALAASMGLVAGVLLPSPPSWYIGILLFLTLTTALVFLALQRFASDSPEIFTRLYLMSITVKILLAATFVIAFVVQDPSGANANAAFFIAGYILFTGLEVIFLVRKSSPPRR